jgi:hypothetical protein
MHTDRPRIPGIGRRVSAPNETVIGRFGKHWNSKRLHKNQGGLMPTLKAEEFCEAFYTWAEACQTELPIDDEDQKQWRKEFAEHWSFIELAIHKNCLLN